MQFSSLEEIVKFAIEKEKEAAVFYENASKEEIFSGSKQMFKDFANEERKHQKMLENLDQKVMTAYEPKKIMDLKRSDYLDEMEYKKGMGFREILTIGMKREEKAMKLYSDLEQRSDNANYKKIFRMLGDEEAKHKLGLETMYDDYMAKMGD